MSDHLDATTQAIIARCEEITEACEAGCAAGLFSTREIRKTCDLCLDFMTAISEVGSADELRAKDTLFAALEEAVTSANAALAERTNENPHVVATVRRCEETLLVLLRTGNATVLVLAGLGCQFKSVVRQALFAFLDDIRRQIKANEEPASRRSLARTLANPIAAVLIRKIKPILAETGEKFESAVKRELRQAKKELRYDYRHPEQTAYGCHHPVPEKDKFVQRLIRSLAVPGVTFSIHAACVSIFGKDHAKTHGWLYDWCNDHRKEIENEVDYRRREGV